MLTGNEYREGPVSNQSWYDFTPNKVVPLRNHIPLHEDVCMRGCIAPRTLKIYKIEMSGDIHASAFFPLNRAQDICRIRG
jgi:hypothetical protein